MKVRKVFIVYKKSTFQIQALEHKEPRFLKLLEAGHDAVTRVKVAHDEHYDTLEQVKEELARRGIEFSAVARVDLNARMKDCDLAISVGGDGTFLEASHYVDSVPLLGVNSSRSSSFGHYCLANESNLSKVLDEIESGALAPVPLLRLELTLNGFVLPEPVLNEVLICHSNPAGTSRYFIEIDAVREEQKSGGVWVGPPGGSTGAIRAAGGVILPIGAQVYQYIVREPGPRPNESWQLLRGVVDRHDEIRIVSQMRTGALYLDGQHIDYGFGLGDELVIKGSGRDLIAYVDPEVNEIFKK